MEDSGQDSGYTGEFYVEQIYDENGNLIDPAGYENENSVQETYAEDGYVQDGYDDADGGYNAHSYADNSYTGNSYSASGSDNPVYTPQNNTSLSAGVGDMSQYNTINLQKVVAESMKELFPDDDDVFAEDREKYNSGEIIGSADGDTRIFGNIMHENKANKKSDNVSVSQNNPDAADRISDRKVKAANNQDFSVMSDNKNGEVTFNEPDSLNAEPSNAEFSNVEPSNAEFSNVESSNADSSNAELLGSESPRTEALESKKTQSEHLDSEVLKAESDPSDSDNQDVGITESYTQTGRVAQMVTSVSEAAPEPHTGAIKKVLIPGDDARFIKAESDMDELRDTTEKTVVEEHSRMEYNDENVYRDQSLPDTGSTDESAPGQTTGSMNLDNVLVEWERMKQDNAKKHQEEIKQHVLTQTGKIFANFDNSIKSGILGELEREEAEAQKSNTSTKNTSGDGFLEADDTGDIPQSQLKPVSEDDFDVAYISDKTEPGEPVSGASETDETETGAKEENITELERVVAQELGGLTEDIPQETISQTVDENLAGGSIAEEDAAEQGTAELEGLDGRLSAERYYTEEAYTDNRQDEPENTQYFEDNEYAPEIETEDSGYYEEGEYTPEAESENSEYYEDSEYPAQAESGDIGHYGDNEYLTQEAESGDSGYYEESGYLPEAESDSIEYYEDSGDTEYTKDTSDRASRNQYSEKELDPEDAESIAEMAKEDALKTQEIKMNTADLSSLSEKIVATTKKEAKGAKREEIREFTPEEQVLFENFAVTKKIKKQIVFALDNITLAAYTGNIIITGDAGLDTVRMAKNLIKEYQESDVNFSGKLAKITGEKINQRNIKDVFEKLNNGGIIIEKANGMSEEKLYEMALNLNQEHLGIVVIMEDTKKEITKLLEKQAMIADYFNIRIDLMEMDNNALVAYAKNYALALEYSIDELGTLALYTRIANMQSGNHVVTKDEVRDIIDEAIWKSKKSKIKNFVDVLFARRYDNEDMIVLKERDFM